MSAIQLACEQAIFTSIRTPTGEGYRIVAASAGLKPEEKQAITRNSPSHESLCSPAESASEQTMGAAFYALPTGRLCLAFSCLAGAEHTGRGGFRVYTINVVFEREAFARCSYNAFHVLRAMAIAGLTQPMLKPPQVLPAVDLCVCLETAPGAEPCFPDDFTTPYRTKVLEAALTGHDVLVEMPGSWIPAAEAIVLGLPGEARESVSFSAGLRFSTSRKHRLQLLREEKNLLRARGGTQRAELVEVGGEQRGAPTDGAWLQFVERHWAAGDFCTLSRRTSRSFGGAKLADLEEIGALYNLIDALDKMPTLRVLELVSAQIRGKQSGKHSDLCDEFLGRAQGGVNQRLARGELADWTQAWRPLLTIWRQSPEGTAFAMPVVRSLVLAWGARDALSAAESALDLTRDVPPGVHAKELDGLIEHVLSRLAAAAATLPGGQAERLSALLAKWHRVRPDSAALSSLAAHQA